MSKTPMTDAIANKEKFGFVPTHFARKLELMLNEAQGELLSTHLAVDDGLLAVTRQRDEWKACAEELATSLLAWEDAYSIPSASIDRFNKLKGTKQ